MPPRRGRGRGRGGNTSPARAAAANTTNNTPEAEQDGDIEMAETAETVESSQGEATEMSMVAEPSSEEVAISEDTMEAVTNGNDALPKVDLMYPHQIKVSPMPEIYNTSDFQRYVATTFKVLVPRVYAPSLNHPHVFLCFDNEKDCEGLLKVIDGYVYRRRVLQAEPWNPAENRKRKLDDSKEVGEQKKLRPEILMTKEEEILSESLPLLQVPYEEQNRLSRQDAELMSSRLHGLLCQKNSDLTGWAEHTVGLNGGNLIQIEPLKVCPNPIGYRNKAKFRVGRNTAGEIVVGFGLNDHDHKILGVEPGDRMAHLPENMKYAAKKFRDFVVSSGKEPYDKRKKTGTFEYLLVRSAPQGSLMLVVIVSTVGHTTEEMIKLKDQLKTYFTTGEAADCNVFSLYVQAIQDTAPIYPRDKLELLAGRADYEENICGLKFCVSPFSILNISPASSENIYNSVIELADPEPDTVLIDACAGSCGIAFTLASRVSKGYAIEPQEDTVRDAQRTRDLNNISNVEIIQGKCEDYLELLFNKEKDKPIIVVIDPPRHGVPTKIMTQIRAQPNVKKVVYVCSNTKTGIKNFLDLASKTGRDVNSGLEYTGLPFLPVKCIPIDCAPYTINTTVPILLERVDPSTFPAATKPAPEVILQDAPKPKPRKKTAAQGNRGGVRGVRGGGVQGPGRGGRGIARGLQDRFRGPAGRGTRPSPRGMGRPMPIMSMNVGMGMGLRGPPNGPAGPAGPGGPGAPRYMENIINKYERRIADLEQQDRAFKMGLQAGLQAATRGGSGGTGGGLAPQMPRSMGDYGTAEAFGGYRGGYKDPYGSSPWQQSGGSGGSSGYGGFGFGGNSSGGGGSSGYGNMDFTSDSMGSSNSMYGSHATGGGGGAGGMGVSRGSMPGSRFMLSQSPSYGAGGNRRGSSGGSGGKRGHGGRGGRGGRGNK